MIVTNFLFSDTVVYEGEGGSPCHKGTEDIAPIGSYTCNQNTSICLGKSGKSHLR